LPYIAEGDVRRGNRSKTKFLMHQSPPAIDRLPSSYIAFGDVWQCIKNKIFDRFKASLYLIDLKLRFKCIAFGYILYNRRQSIASYGGNAFKAKL